VRAITSGKRQIVLLAMFASSWVLLETWRSLQARYLGRIESGRNPALTSSCPEIQNTLI